MTLPFHSPTSILISGCTSSGKSKFLKELLLHKNKMFSTPPHKVIYHYNIWQPLFDSMEKEQKVDFVQGFPSRTDIDNLDRENHTVMVLDDLQHTIVKNKLCEELLTQLSHHANITVIYVVQNIYYPGLRTLTLNTHDIILFRNLRDILQISMLARQVGMGDFLVQAYKDCTRIKYGYLVIDLCPHSDDEYRLRTNILPENNTVVYQSR